MNNILSQVDIGIIHSFYDYALAVADPGEGGGGGPGGPDPPPFGPRYRLFNIGPKVGPPLLLVDLRCSGGSGGGGGDRGDHPP